LVCAFLLLVISAHAWGQPFNKIAVSPSTEGPVIEFGDADYILADGLNTAEHGWKRAPSPYFFRMRDTNWRTGDFHTLEGRFRFDRSKLGDAPFALYTVSTRNQFTVFVNGNEINRNFAKPGDQILAWYRPYLIPLPAASLRPGMNEIRIRATSQDSIGIGRVAIGPDAVVRQYYQSQFFWQISAPAAVNFAMLLLGLLALLLWLGRRQEVELLWLGLSTGFWFLRNYQYFAEVTPFNLALFNALTVYATYFATVGTAAFYFNFTKLPHRNPIIGALFLAGIPMCIAHTWFLVSNLVFYIPTILVMFGVALLALRDVRRHRNVEHGVLGIVLLLMPVASLRDAYLAGWDKGWNGGGFYLSVFGGLIYCVAFLISFGKRALDAFVDLGKVNIVLEERIAETRAELAVSEASRQQLVVAQAISDERGRLMQEMHDGIGSNLITALAVARQQNQPASTVKTLRRALADLKITVDSLEPVEGNLVALIGNLRHRMAGDLRDAGIKCKWNAEACGPLTWLDATNALHVLRIFQEAIGNVLTHSGATEMQIGCREQSHKGVAGIAAYVNDNGVGFDPDDTSFGKGLANIRARALSLHGVLSCGSRPDEGTIITLWLPYARNA
jgi:signal transduction histidine kinase